MFQQLSFVDFRAARDVGRVRTSSPARLIEVDFDLFVLPPCLKPAICGGRALKHEPKDEVNGIDFHEGQQARRPGRKRIMLEGEF